ncbi:MAG: ATP-grasp domain-containing protein [Actinobacteria bacterium]|nr:ATP-grasp domain-containing protein [Actinomycetota bacterium]
MFTKVLIANRGEIALRINSTLERLGISAVGVYTHHDRDSLHVARISESYLLDDRQQSGYLNSQQIIAAALASNSEAIHPGYGFLAENAQFAQACHDVGLIFIGPPADAMTAMGEKISAREYATRAGVPVVPGIGEPAMSDAELLDACRDLRFPLLVKPAAGGGGKGLHVAHDLNELREVLPTARREAKTAFGDETLLVEKYLLHARHIEFQVAADNYGSSMHLGERECSLQRRHQKVVEEAPAPRLSESNREIMGAAALALTSTIGYQNLGTIEFLVDADSPETFYFMEMNTRLQVEHRVTEMITGLDLVECQLRLAAGEPLKEVIPTSGFTGHAIEARIYAEDAFNGFLPTGGVIGRFTATDTNNTVTDSAIRDGALVSSSFDPMLAKIACWGEDRQSALKELREALSNTVLLGVTTNIDFLIQLLHLRDIEESKYDTKYLEACEIERAIPSPALLSAYAAMAAPASKVGSWRADGWRLNGMPRATIAAYIDGVRHDVSTESGSTLAVDFYRDDADYWLHHRSFGTWLIKEANERRISTDRLSDEIVSPMPGVVIAVNVAIGDQVKIGDPLVVIEAMKMEHIVRARHSGHVLQCNVALGANVRVGQLLLEVVEDV